MIYKNTADFIKPTIITAQQYGTKVSVEIDHSDTDIDELFEAFQTICVGLGYHDSAWKGWIVDKADEYKEEAAEEAIYEPSPQLKKVAEEYVNMLREQEIDAALAEHNADEDADWDITLNDGLENDGWTPELEQQFWSEQPSEPFATPEELSRDGGFDGNPHFEWGDEAEDDGDELEWPEPNEVIKKAAKEYKKATKKKK
jgi:hypothetical protein